MAILLLILVGGPLAGTLFSGWKAWDYSRWWRPAMATTLASDYSETDREKDKSILGSFRPLSWKYNEGQRLTRCHVGFKDANGRLREGDVTIAILPGSDVTSTFKLYYDTRNPTRLSHYGLSGAVIGACLWAGVLLLILYRIGAVWMRL